MSLTQERIYTIATEIAHNTVVSEALFDKELFDFVDAFLSRIREEQEAVAEVAKGNFGNRLLWDTEVAQINTPVGTKLFTIPPAAPESACKELVEALEYYEMGDDGDKAKQALAKHKASMGEK